MPAQPPSTYPMQIPGSSYLAKITRILAQMQQRARLDKAKVYLVMTVGLLALSSPLTAATIYRSVDAHGHVTYSNIPPTNPTQQQEVTVPTAPKAEDVQHVLDNKQRLEAELNRMQQERIAGEQAQAKQRAQAANALTQARHNLKLAQQIRDEDWQQLKGRHRFLKESYFNRVEAALKALKAAEQAAQ